MDMGKKIEMLRKEKGMTLEELGDKVGVGKSTVRKWENGMIANMRRDKIAKIASALGVSPAALMGWEEEPASPDTLSSHEIRMISKYRSLDNRGRNLVDVVLDHEYDYVMHPEQFVDEMAEYLYLGKVAAAGTWVYPGDIPLERVTAKKRTCADFIVGVSGDSMQPTFDDGDMVYVKKTTDITHGDIGLFIVGGYYYIKEYAGAGLHSHNPKYNTIPADAGIIVVGKVLGKV